MSTSRSAIIGSEKAAAAKKEARAARRKAKSAEKKAEHVAEATGDSLDWKERMVENRVVHEAKFNGGSFKILRAGQRWALFYEWKDQTFRDLEVGSVDHLKWTAEVFVKHGMHRFGTAREFVDAATAEGPDRFAPPMDGTVIVSEDGTNADRMVLKVDQGPDFVREGTWKTVNLYKLSGEDLRELVLPRIDAWVKAGRTQTYYEAVFAELVAEGFDRATVKRVEHLIFISEYKRFQSAPGARLTRRAFWLDRRYPVANRWRDKT